MLDRVFVWLVVLALGLAPALSHAQSAQIRTTVLGYQAPAPVAAGGCSQATALIARMDGSQNTSAVTTLICGMVTDGTYSGFDGLYVFATNSTTNALLNWAQSSFNLTSNGTPTFTANQGYTGAASAFLDTSFTPSTAGGQMTQNSASLGVCDLTSRTTTLNAIAIGGQDGTSGVLLAPLKASANTTSVELTGNSFPDAATGITNAQGSWIVTRVASTGLTVYANGASSATPSDTSTALFTAKIFILAYDQGGGGSFFTDKVGYAFMGKGFTAGDVSNIYSRLHTYMVAVGASGC